MVSVSHALRVWLPPHTPSPAAHILDSRDVPHERLPDKRHPWYQNELLCCKGKSFTAAVCLRLAGLERARREFHVGDLCFNCKCTGALVDVQPFGRFHMSGTDSKAGGRDYPQLLMQAKTFTERF